MKEKFGFVALWNVMAMVTIDHGTKEFTLDFIEVTTLGTGDVWSFSGQTELTKSELARVIKSHANDIMDNDFDTINFGDLTLKTIKENIL